MSEWWTYRLSDFLMFSPRTYWRLVELYNLDGWPLHLAALLAGFIALALAASRKAAALRVMVALLAAAWLWVGWAFHWQRYATINWAAQYAAVAFALQALLLLAVGLRGGAAALTPGPGMRGFGWALAAAGLAAYPFMAWMTGRPWLQAEVFGMAPEPTALATVGLLLISPVAGQRARLLLCAIPCVSLLAGAATLWTFLD